VELRDLCSVSQRTENFYDASTVLVTPDIANRKRSSHCVSSLNRRSRSIRKGGADNSTKGLVLTALAGQESSGVILVLTTSGELTTYVETPTCARPSSRVTSRLCGGGSAALMSGLVAVEVTTSSPNNSSPIKRRAGRRISLMQAHSTRHGTAQERKRC